MQAYLGDIIAHSVPDCHNKVNTTVESCEFFGFLVHIKLGGDKIPVELFQILKDDAV